MNDLRAIGLTGKWLEIAERVGMDAWLDIWEILDRENIDQPPSHRDAMRIRIPAFSKLIKRARNKFIRNALQSGVDAKTIHSLLHRADIEPVSVKFIQMYPR